LRLACRLAIIATFLQTLCAFTLESLQVPSAGMGKSISTTVVVPKDYRTSLKPLPVVYLLHGYHGNDKDWSKSTPIGELADEYNVLVVCPNGENSWYFDSPENPKSKFETFVSNELVHFIDKRYRTIPARSGRATLGLSMGGHGALFLAIRHRDIFGAAASMSGGVDLRPFSAQFEIRNALGTIQAHPERWDEYSVISQVKSLKDGDLAISMDCGVSDFFIEVNRALHQKLLEQKIAHDYAERPGAHTWDYWRNSMPYEMLFLTTYFKKAGGTPMIAH
jgi:S-formylglutathione hydrolase FrmB